MTRMRFLPVFLLVALASGAPPAFANGGDFFEELSASWKEHNPDEGRAFFGFIKDTRGRLIGDVAVSATTGTGSTFVVQSDSLGHYRIPGFSKSVDATRVTITCSKPGYKFIARDKRILRSAVNPPIEVNCILAPQSAA